MSITDMTKEKLAVMQAFIEGKIIESAMRGEWEWEQNSSPAWDWKSFDYRIKQEPPKPREWWVVMIRGGALGVFDSEERANSLRDQAKGSSIVHVREVLE